MLGFLWLLSALFACVAAQCYDNWVMHESSCYGFGEEDVSWAGAAALCGIFDGSLAEIDSEDENNFLKATAQNRSYKSLWIGGTDIFSEGTWIWINSKALIEGFTDWYPGEPNHSGGATAEDCLQLYGSENMKWNDEDCQLKTRFVCEIQI